MENRIFLGQPFPYDPISMRQLSFAKLGLYTSHSSELNLLHRNRDKSLLRLRQVGGK